MISPSNLLDNRTGRYLLATSHGDHTVKIHDTNGASNPLDGEEKTKSSINGFSLLSVLEGHPRTPWCVKFHPNNNGIVASGCLGGEVRVWDWKRRRCLHVARVGGSHSILGLSFFVGLNPPMAGAHNLSTVDEKIYNAWNDDSSSGDENEDFSDNDEETFVDSDEEETRDSEILKLSSHNILVFIYSHYIDFWNMASGARKIVSRKQSIKSVTFCPRMNDERDPDLGRIVFGMQTDMVERLLKGPHGEILRDEVTRQPKKILDSRTGQPKKFPKYDLILYEFRASAITTKSTKSEDQVIFAPRRIVEDVLLRK